MIKKDTITITLDKTLIPKLKVKLKDKAMKLSTLINKLLTEWIDGTR